MIYIGYGRPMSCMQKRPLSEPKIASPSQLLLSQNVRVLCLLWTPCAEEARPGVKLAFTPQTFEDLGVEKEVAVRRRMAKE